MWIRAAYLAGSIATLSISSAAAQPPENATTAAIQAQGIGATAIVGVQPDSHLNVIMQQRASMNGPAPQAHAQGNAALHISTSVSANQTTLQFNSARMHGAQAATGMHRDSHWITSMACSNWTVSYSKTISERKTKHHRTTKRAQRPTPDIRQRKI